MDRRIFVLMGTAAALLIGGCTSNKQEQPKPAQESFSQAPATSPTSAAGIHWTVPNRWAAQMPKPMRVATYGIPPAAGDTEAAECAVFFFGSGQGGDVDMNIQRWAQQFENAGTPARTDRKVNGFTVTLIQISGTYLAPSGPMMQSQGRKENYRLLGAIVAAPDGSVFFKLTGPAKTVASAEKEFNELIGSIGKQSPA